MAGGPGFTLTVNGANFLASSIVQLNGSSRPTTFVSGTQLQGAISAADIAAGAQDTITVANPAGQGGVSGGFNFTINNPMPAIAGLNPSAVAAGGSAFTLTVSGTNFVPTSTVQFNGTARPTTFVSSVTLQAAITAADIAKVGLDAVTVSNPAPGGGVSGSSTFTSAFPPPRITLLQPSSAVHGGGDFTMTVTGTNFVPSSVVKFNGSVRPTTFVSSTELQATITAADIAGVGVADVTVFNVVTNVAKAIAANAGVDPTTSGPSTFFTGTTGGPGFAAVVVNQAAQDIVFDPSQQVIYASVNASAASNPNTISVLSLATASITSSHPAGTNPNVLAISDDSQFLYAGIDGAAIVQRFTLPGLQKDISYSLGSDSFFGPFFALDLQVAPGAPHTTAVTLANVGVSPSAGGGIAIFDDATQRPAKLPGFGGTGNLFDSIQWGADATTLAASNFEDSAADFYTLTVNQSGVSLKQDSQGAGGSRIHYDAGTNLFYGENGNTVGFNGLPAGNFNTFGTMAADSSLNKAFFMQFGSSTISSYNLRHFTPIGSISIPQVNGFARHLIRWGQNGLAFTTDSDQIVLVAGNFLDPAPLPPPPPTPTPTPTPTPPPAGQPAIASLSPSSAVAGGPDFTLVVSGTNFDPAAQVQVNGSPRTTTFISSTQLQAAITAADIFTVGVANITVVNPANNGGTSSAFAFFIGTTQVNGTAIAIFNQPAKDIAFDPVRQVIYFTVSSANPDGNSVSALDLTTGTVTASQFAGSNPNLLAISSDWKFLYASIDGSVSVQRFGLPGLVPDINYSLGGDSFIGPKIALDLQVAPSAPGTTAVVTSAEGGITIFDDATARPTQALSFGFADTLQWGADDNTLFASDFSGDLFTLSVDGGGVTETHDFSGILGNGNRIHFNSGTNLVYSESGRIADPSAGLLAAIFQASGPMVPDATLNAAFFVNQRFPFASNQVDAFDLTHFTLARSITIPNVTGNARRLIRWGQNGLAFNTDSGQIVLLGGDLLTPIPATMPPPAPLPTPAPTPAVNAPTITVLTPSSAVAGGGGFTLTVNGANFDPAAQVQFNGSPRTTNFISSTQLQAAISDTDIAAAGAATVRVANPIANGGVSAGSTFFVGTSGGNGFALSVLNQAANDLVFDPLHNVILLSVPSTAGAHGNTISALDPASGSIISSQFAGSEPNILALSDDRGFIYAGIDGAGKVQRFTLPDFGVDISYSLGLSFFNGPNLARDLQVAPQAPHTTAVSNSQAQLTVFDDATPRPTIAPTVSSVQWGADATTLFAISGRDLLSLGVDASGVTPGQDFRAVLGNGPRIHFIGGTKAIYSDDGHAVDSSSGLPIGNYNVAGLMVPDPTLNKAFFLNQPLGSSNATIEAFDLARFTTAGSITIPNVNGNAGRLIRWGQNGLAFNTSGGQLFLLGGNFLDPSTAPAPTPIPTPTPTPTPGPQAPTITSLSPASAIAGSAAFTMIVNGSQFTSSSTVQFNGNARATTFVSSTQLQAGIGVADLASVGTGFITVFDPANGTSSPFTFFIGSAAVNGVAVAVLNDAAEDIVFDPARQVIYLSVPNTAGSAGNSISVLDLATASIAGSQFAGSNPNLLAISDDGQFLYAGIDGLASVQRFTLPGLGADIQYSLVDPSSGPQSALDLQVAPGAPHTTAVLPGTANNFPQPAVTVYDDATPRPTRGPSVSTLQWGLDATTLFASGGFDLDLLTLSVGPSGVVQNQDFPAALGNGKIHFDKGTKLVYSESGRIVDPVTGLPVGIFQNSGVMVPDSTLNAAFFVNQQSGTQVESFDLTHFTPVGSIAIPGVQGKAKRLIRWGQNGLAFNTDGGQVVLMGGALPTPTSLPSPLPIPTPAPTPAPTNSTPAITSLSPSSAVAGGSDVALTVNGANFTNASVVRFNGTPLTTTFVNSSQLTATIPAADIAAVSTALITAFDPTNGSSSAATFFIGSTGGTSTAQAGFAVSIINQTANDLLFDKINQIFFVSVPSTAGSHGNTITALDLSGNVISSQFAGSEPGVLALSDDSQFIYAGVNGAAKVQRITLPDMGADVSYSIGVEPFFGPFFPLDVQVAPAQPRTTAVTLAGSGAPAARGGVMIFDDATARPTKAPGFDQSTNIFATLQWGADATQLFAGNNEDTGFDFYTLTVSPSGVSLNHDFPGVLSGGRRIHFDAGSQLIYSDDGRVVNPATGAVVGTFNTGASFFALALMVPDSKLNTAFFLTQSFGSPNVTIQSFNLTTLALLDSITVPNVTGAPQRLVRWGTNGLAFNTDRGEVVLVGGSFVH